MGKFVKKLIDPAGILTGQPNIADALDPGSAIIKSGTGSDIGRKIADPAGLLKSLDPPEFPEVSALPTIDQGLATPELRATKESVKLQAATQAGRAQQILEKKRKGKRSTVLTSGLGLTNTEDIQRPTVLGVG